MEGEDDIDRRDENERRDCREAEGVVVEERSALLPTTRMVEENIVELVLLADAGCVELG
jgi:hypothetical protein